MKASFKKKKKISEGCPWFFSSVKHAFSKDDSIFAAGILFVGCLDPRLIIRDLPSGGYDWPTGRERSIMANSRLRNDGWTLPKYFLRKSAAYLVAALYEWPVIVAERAPGSNCTFQRPFDCPSRKISHDHRYFSKRRTRDRTRSINIQFISWYRYRSPKCTRQMTFRATYIYVLRALKGVKSLEQDYYTANAVSCRRSTRCAARVVPRTGNENPRKYYRPRYERNCATGATSITCIFYYYYFAMLIMPISLSL